MFLRDKDGRRPVYGGTEKFQEDPNWKDCLLFYEYFHGDNGAGLGASHQTGWTGLVASLIDEWRTKERGAGRCFFPPAPPSGGRGSFFFLPPPPPPGRGGLL